MKLTLLVCAGLLFGTPAFAHEIAQTLTPCGCDTQCFTDEVDTSSCSGNTRHFTGTGFPASDHDMMVGITATNQQFPIAHTYEFRLPIAPKYTGNETPTVPGAIGVAVNGVPLFDPSTQGPPQANGKPVSAADAGELDSCGGHAGRGDDYHYHHAPNCLIDQLGRDAVEVKRQPIGFAADGFPIHALGWFDRANKIETKLDTCRGATDATGQYFYNVSTQKPYAILNCYNGATDRGFARDKWDPRKDASGREIVGIPVKFTIKDYARGTVSGDLCHRMTGTLTRGKLAKTNGSTTEARNLAGSIFYCSQTCYGQFLARSGGGPRVLYFDRQTSGCTADLKALKNNAFLDFAAE